MEKSRGEIQFFKISVFIKLANFAGNHLLWSPFFKSRFLKQASNSTNIFESEIFKNTFFTEHLQVTATENKAKLRG